MVSNVVDSLWAFARGDRSDDDFEYWLYQQYDNPNLRAELGDELWCLALEVNYRDVWMVANLRDRIRFALSDARPAVCACLTWRDYDVVTAIDMPPADFGVYLEPQFLTIAEVDGWLSAVRCTLCGQAWCTAVEADYEDYYCQRLLRRLTEVEVAQVQYYEDNLSVIVKELAFGNPSTLWREALTRFAQSWSERHRNRTIYFV